VLLDPDSEAVDLARELVDLRGGDGMGGDRQLWDGLRQWREEEDESGASWSGAVVDESEGERRGEWMRHRLREWTGYAAQRHVAGRFRVNRCSPKFLDPFSSKKRKPKNSWVQPKILGN
jgi:hypothetical protein